MHRKHLEKVFVCRQELADEVELLKEGLPDYVWNSIERPCTDFWGLLQEYAWWKKWIEAEHPDLAEKCKGMRWVEVERREEKE